MKRILLLLLTLLFCFLFCINCFAEDKPLRIAVASDLHLQEPNWDTGLANPLVPCGLQIIDALLWDVAEQQADVLLLCGDITNQGKLKQHEMLIERLQSLKDQGVKVYVLPGNHDIGEVTPEKFVELYAAFGYTDACSIAPDSISYSILIGNQLILMLDTNGYTGDRYTAYLTDATLQWMEDQLQAAASQGWHVLAAGHYPMVTPHTTRFLGKDEATSLFQRYGMPLYLCGHLHGRGVALADSLTEMTIDQAISYPCNYALFTAENGTYTYQPHEINVEGWAAAVGEQDERFVSFTSYKTALTYARCCDTITALKRDRELSPEAQEQVTDFFWRFWNDHAQGTLYHSAEELLQHPGYAVFMDIAEGTTYGRWLPGVLPAVMPYTAGFIIRNG